MTAARRLLQVRANTRRPSNAGVLPPLPVCEDEAEPIPLLGLEHVEEPQVHHEADMPLALADSRPPMAQPTLEGVEGERNTSLPVSLEGRDAALEPIYEEITERGDTMNTTSSRI